MRTWVCRRAKPVPTPAITTAHVNQNVVEQRVAADEQRGENGRRSQLNAVFGGPKE
jgi:hypothetical protein